MSDYLQNLYSQPEDVDAHLAAAGDLVSKIAAEEGVDLNAFSDEEVGAMINEVAFGGGGQPKVAHERSASSEITVADVAQELSKVAAAEGVDLSDLSREEYSAALNAMHGEMSDPSYYQSKVAMEEKVAEADMLGRVMAHSFMDEREKIALTMGEAKERGSAALGSAKTRASELGAAAKSRASSAAASADKGVQSLGSKLDRAIKSRQLAAGKTVGASSANKLRAMGGGLGAAGLLAASGIGYAAKKGVEKLRDKQSYDEDVVATAIALLEEAGYEV